MASIRGKKVLQALEDAIKQLSDKAAQENKKYIFNASELQRITGISRVTISKYQDEIENILEDVKASARVQYGKAHLQALLNQIDNLTKDIRDLEKENQALKEHHANIYSLLYSHSVDAAGLIKSELYNELDITGKCILCGTKIEQKKKANNVVQIKRKQKK